MLKFAVLASLIVLSACNSRAPATAVDLDTLQKHIHEWNGQTVLVDGYLGKCAGYDCAIFPQPITEQHYKTLFEDGFNAEEYRKSLPIGSAGSFDSKAQSLQFRRVLLKAKINDNCHRNRCFDRADILQPIDIKPYKEG